jgi:hypothetical protein
MTTLPLSSIIVARQIAEREFGSARLDAPVVPDRPRADRRGPTLRRTRTATATVLHRAAHRISPA